MQTNKDRLVEIGICGQIAPALGYGTEVDYAGRPFLAPGIGGIVYNVKVGDSAMDWAGDHIEPGVSMLSDPAKRSDRVNRGLNSFGCVGNTAVVMSGDAKGARGVVTGHHGGVEHLIIDFDDKRLYQMCIGDKIMVHGVGQGLKLLDYPEVTLYNCSPTFLDAWKIIEEKKALRVPATHVVPAHLMGSGIGELGTHYGDYDIMTSDPESVTECKLNSLRLGDIVAIMDHDNTYGRCYRRGHISFGIVIHSDSKLAGHGPGVATLMTGPADLLRPELTPLGNIGPLLRIGRYRKSSMKKQKKKNQA